MTVMTSICFYGTVYDLHVFINDSAATIREELKAARCSFVSCSKFVISPNVTVL